MLNSMLVSFYERDLRKVIEELNQFKNEADLWRTQGSVKNSSGNLVLHLIGGMNYHIGANMGHTGYVRDREQEFSRKGVERKVLVDQLETLMAMIGKTVNAMPPEDMEAEYPMVFDGEKRTNSYMLVQLLTHLNYHLGQVNYLRRII